MKLISDYICKCFLLKVLSVVILLYFLTCCVHFCVHSLNISPPLAGYGKEADLWSVGVIMFLLLCGKLPFDGDDHNEIIRSTIQVGI